MEEIGKAKTVGELIEVLKKLPPDYKWNGWDDGSITINNGKPFVSNEFKNIGYIEPDLEP